MMLDGGSMSKGKLIRYDDVGILFDELNKLLEPCGVRLERAVEDATRIRVSVAAIPLPPSLSAHDQLSERVEARLKNYQGKKRGNTWGRIAWELLDADSNLYRRYIKELENMEV